MSLQPLDGPSLQDTLSISTVSVLEVKSGVTALPERKVITIQPLDGSVYIYFGDGDNIPTTTDVSTKGFLHNKKLKESYEASETQPVFILAVSGTVDVRFAERA